MAEERDDYQADIRFGEWLRSQRVRAGLNLEKAALGCSIPTERLKALEMGLSERGVTRQESVRICSAYKISLNEFLEQAARA